MSQKPMKIRKLPVEVEGMLFTHNSGQDVIDWIRSYGRSANWNFFSRDDQSVDIVTLEGIMETRLGDIVIKGVNNEFYPCKPDIFYKTYEVISDATQDSTSAFTSN